MKDFHDFLVSDFWVNDLKSFLGWNCSVVLVLVVILVASVDLTFVFEFLLVVFPFSLVSRISFD